MPPIRNSCVARGGAAAGATTTVYTVPASTVLLLKDVHMTPAATGSYTISLGIQPSGAAFTVWLIYAAPETTAITTWSGWVALNAGDTLILNPVTIGVYYWISGALLPFVPGF